MDFKEACEHLNSEKKIRRKKWEKSIYLSKTPDNNVQCYLEECVPFVYNIDIINSNDWIVRGESGDIHFSDAVIALNKGKNVKLKHWPVDCFLEATRDGKEVFMRRITDFMFTPTFECFSSDDWEIVEEEINNE